MIRLVLRIQIVIQIAFINDKHYILLQISNYIIQYIIY